MNKYEIKKSIEKLRKDLIEAIEKMVKPAGIRFPHSYCVTSSLGFDGPRVDSMCWTSGHEQGEYLNVQVYNPNKDCYGDINLRDLEIGDLSTIFENIISLQGE